MTLFPDTLILIRGAGDLASGVAYRLKRSGFPILMTDLPCPSFVRRAVSYGEAVYRGEIEIEGLHARFVESIPEAQTLAQQNYIPILIQPYHEILAAARPQVVVDAIMAKTNKGTMIHDAPFVVALGPGFTVGEDCHAIVETNRGHRLGRVIWHGAAEPNSGTPGKVAGYAAERVLRAPAAGQITPMANIGDLVEAGQLIAMVGNHEICAPFPGVLRGLIHPKVRLTPGFKIGDLDPRGVVEHCFTISDKSLAVGGGVVEAVFSSGLATLTAKLPP